MTVSVVRGSARRKRARGAATCVAWMMPAAGAIRPLLDRGDFDDDSRPETYPEMFAVVEQGEPVSSMRLLEVDQAPPMRAVLCASPPDRERDAVSSS